MANAYRVELRGCASYTTPQGRSFRKGQSQPVTGAKEQAYFDRFKNIPGALFSVTVIEAPKKKRAPSKKKAPAGNGGKKTTNTGPDEGGGDAPL